MTTYTWQNGQYEKTFVDWPVLEVDFVELYPNIDVYEGKSDSNVVKSEDRQYFCDLFRKYNLSFNLSA